MSSEASEASDRESSSRRRSGRVVKVPAKFTPEPSAQPSASKRKRSDQQDEEDDADGVDNHTSDSDNESGDDGDHGSDDDHPAPNVRKPRPAAQSGRAKKPSLKKPKINGAQPVGLSDLAPIPSRPKKSVRIDAAHKGTGLFAEVFGSGRRSAEAAQEWLQSYRSDDGLALVDLINCILQCCGCEQEVTLDDIRDEENIPNRLRDLQTTHQEMQIGEYPLISRSKNTKSFKDVLVAFFMDLVEVLHETDLLYKEGGVMEHLQAWLASMSSASVRAFRHTATTISLAVQSGLVKVASALDNRIAKVESSLAAAKRAKNKTKAAEIQKNLSDANGYRKICSETIQSFFDIVYVHRYRDVDAKIRTECVEALGYWIYELPTVFLEPGYLRYLGWMLSDINPATRQEVLKQLLRVFRRDASQLGHFIERFRPRLAEMARHDTEVFVRVAAISVIDALRANALLEPSEIDSIGMLIFDDEIRVRKAVVNFFIACVEDVQDGKIEEMGGSDILDEFRDVDEDDFATPREEWVTIKSLAETLAAYDAQIQEQQQNSTSDELDLAVHLLEGTLPGTSISHAAQVLYEKVHEIKQWGLLAGYLLHDHTTSAKSKSKTKGMTSEAAFKKAVAPTEAEELILLNVLCSAVKLSLTQPETIDKNKKKLSRQEVNEVQEDVALQLAEVIPKLLSKFGADPEAAAVILRLEHFLNLEAFQHLRQDSSTYEKLLDGISAQFDRHSDRVVLSEAATALLHARQYPELEELTDTKLALLWENVVTNLRACDSTCELSVRGNLAEGPLRDLSTVLTKMSKLAGAADCVDVLEAEGTSDDSKSPAIEMLSNIVHRGKYEPQEDEIDDLEDEVVSSAIQTCQFYFMWKTRILSKRILSGSMISEPELSQLSVLRQTYRRHLIETLSSRAAIDQLRLQATGSLCDLHLTFATLRHPIKQVEAQNSSDVGPYKPLIQDLEPGLVPELVSIFDGTEKQFAKRAKKDKLLNEPAEDEDPMADDEEADDESDEDEGLSERDRLAAQLKAERALCQLTAKYVMAIESRLLDQRGPQAGKLRRRMLRNQTKLGNNFREIVSHLDGERTLRKPAAATAPTSSAAATRPGSAVSISEPGKKRHVGGRNEKPVQLAKKKKSEEIVVDEQEDDEQNQPDEHGHQDAVQAEVVEEEDEEEQNGMDEDMVEEGTEEDLRRRELLEEEVIDDDEDDDSDGADGPTKRARGDADDDDDDDDGLGD